MRRRRFLRLTSEPGLSKCPPKAALKIKTKLLVDEQKSGWTGAASAAGDRDGNAPSPSTQSISTTIDRDARSAQGGMRRNVTSGYAVVPATFTELASICRI